ncbi:proto-oncogene tyrosine-protein kinase receptor ret-like protein [Lasius niger]|uniref:Proto-oncogene tyrosine-protein kinase receptor ret-like protein n=1 Tax=Lasius niger TaxID=67767 RepID=A0A0J7KPE8_LASNI|nr:proto-oncogene tyrosine-protein kinase receptor ret-like protein [Lasius niger]
MSVEPLFLNATTLGKRYPIVSLRRNPKILFRKIAEEETSDKRNGQMYCPFCISGLYFPQSNLTLRVPYLARHGMRASLEVKLNLRTLRNDSTVPQDVNYQIFNSQLPEKSIPYEKNTSKLVLQDLPQNGRCI